MVRRAAGWLLCLGLVAAGLLLAVVASLPLWAGPLIARHATAALGRSVTIGRVDLHLRTPVTVTAQDVVIGNPDGFAADQKPFARVSRLTIRIDVTASIHRGTMVITSVEMDQPVIHIVQTTDGLGNYHLPTSSGVPVTSRRSSNCALGSAEGGSQPTSG